MRFSVNPWTSGLFFIHCPTQTPETRDLIPHRVYILNNDLRDQTSNVAESCGCRLDHQSRSMQDGLNIPERASRKTTILLPLRWFSPPSARWDRSTILVLFQDPDCGAYTPAGGITGKPRRKTRRVGRFCFQLPPQSMSFYSHSMAHDTSSDPSPRYERTLQTNHCWDDSPATLRDRIGRHSSIDGKSRPSHSHEIRMLWGSKGCQQAVGVRNAYIATRPKRFLIDRANGAIQDPQTASDEPVANGPTTIAA